MRQIIAQGIQRSGQRMVVVRPVSNQIRRPMQHFQAAGPFHRIQSENYGAARNRKPGGGQLLCRCGGGSGIGRLKVAQQRQPHPIVAVPRVNRHILPIVAALPDPPLHGIGHADARRTPAGRHGLNHPVGRLKLLRRNHYRGARLDDARFVGGDGANRIAQYRHMIQAYRSDYADRRPDYIRGVQPPSQSDFNDTGIGLFLLKMSECHGGKELKQRRRPGVRVGGVGEMPRPYRCGESGESFLAHRLPVVANPLAERMQMRR